MWTSTTPTLAALILLAMTSGAISALGLAMGHVWMHHPATRGAHRRPTRTRRLAETLIWAEHPAQLPTVDPESTQRIRDVDTGPTAVLRISTDPWAAREDADSLLALAA